MLVYEKAEKNIPQNQELKDLVENYRSSLIIYEYQQQVLSEKMQTEIFEADLMDFYKSNSNRFPAERNLVKGIFLKVPRNARKTEFLNKIEKDLKKEAEKKREITYY